MTYIAQQVSRAIRILRGNRDESARASHLVVEKDLLMTYESAFFSQAETEKYSQSTFFERKIMSTKTAFKRVALVAAAALAIGGITAVAAQAATVGVYTPTITSGTTTLTTTGATATYTAGVVGSPVNFNLNITGSNTPTAADTAVTTPVITGTAGTKPAVSALNPTVGTLVNSTGAVVTATGVSTETVTATAAASAVFGYTVTPLATGTTVITFTTVGSTTVVATLTITVTATTATVGSATGIVGGYDSVQIGLGTAETAKIINVASTGVGTMISPSIAAGTNTAAISNATTLGFSIWGSATTTDVIGSANNVVLGTGGVGGATINLSASSAAAGTQTITLTGVGAGTLTVTITWGAAPVVSTALSAYGTATTATTVALGTVATIAVPASTSAVAFAGFRINNSANTVLTTEKLTATITGPGLVQWGTSAVGATFVADGGAGKSLTAPTIDPTLQVIGDGTAGLSTITVTDGTTAIATFTVTFTGAAAKAVATQNLFVAKAASSTTLGNTGTAGVVSSTKDLTPATGYYAYTVAVTDSNGNVSNPSVFKAVSSDTTVIASSTCYASSTVTGTFYCNVVASPLSTSGKTATVTFEASSTASTSSYDILAAPLTFAVGGGIVKEVLSTDATSYNALAPVVVTVSATDSAGFASYDQTQAGGLTSTLTSTTQLGGAAFTATSFTNLINGKSSFSGVYAPSVAGDFTLSGTDAISTAGEALTVTATGNGGSADAAGNAATDAANEATDAANAATDAANAAADSADAATQAAQDASDQAAAALAAVTALSQQVTDLSAKIAALGASLAKITATLAKVASKVKA